MAAKVEISNGLIADIFDFALQENGLGHMAESVARHVGVDGAAMFLVRADQPPEAYANDALREQHHLYQAYYHRLDPWPSRGFVPRHDRLVLANELFPEADLVKTEFYTGFARPMGMFRPMSAYFDLGGGAMAAIGVEQPFSKRLFEPDDKRRLEPLMPFLRRALLLRLKVKAFRQEARLGFDALEALGLGIVVCREDGFVVRANAAARACEALGIRLDGPRGLIRTGRHAETLQLHEAIRAAAAGSGRNLRLGSEGAYLAALVTPLPRDDAADAHVMLTLRRESAVPSPNPAVLRALYGLSAAQAQLCVLLARGCTFEQCAAETGTAVTTMRSHFAAVLTRTGARNLRDLIRLLGAVSPGAGADRLSGI